jgi:uncharacterized protein YqgV (UPF0045/DUF77 family)
MAIQVLPVVAETDYTLIIDKAIDVIASSGAPYKVTPFETVVEGRLEDLLALIPEIRRVCELAGAVELIIQIKIHTHSGTDLSFASKLEKYS